MLPASAPILPIHLQIVLSASSGSVMHEPLQQSDALLHDEPESLQHFLSWLESAVHAPGLPLLKHLVASPSDGHA